MKIDIDLKSDELDRFIRRYPQAMSKSIELFTDRVGFTLEGQSKREAPAISGNLRRNIIYADSTIAGFMNNTVQGTLTAHANYSGFVHGAPFHKNKMRRRETPFFTNAIRAKESFIKDEAKAILTRVIK